MSHYTPLLWANLHCAMQWGFDDALKSIGVVGLYDGLRYTTRELVDPVLCHALGT